MCKISNKQKEMGYDFYRIKITNKKICSDIQALLILGSLEQESIIILGLNDAHTLNICYSY
jgi:hypothetical protein